MYTGQVATISSKATWLFEGIELVDEDTGTTTDLTTAGTVDILVTITDPVYPQYILTTASIANGKVTIPGPGFQWQFEVADLAMLCSGTYKLGVKVTINGFVNDLVDGTITVVEGN